DYNFTGHCVGHEIVLAAVNDNLFWFVWNDDFVSVLDYVRQTGASKSAVDHLVVWEILLYILPHPERGTSYKNNGLLGRFLNTVALLKTSDLSRKRTVLRRRRK